MWSAGRPDPHLIGPRGSAAGTDHIETMSATLTTSGLTAPNADQTAELQAWRALAIEKMPYMAAMLFSLRPLNAPGLGTFAVDAAHRLYIDFEAVSEKGPRWCAEALLHECCHLFGRHAERAEMASVTRDEQMMSNVAADAEINDDLRDGGCDMSDAVLPATIGADDYQTYEHYLDVMRSRPQPPSPSQSGSGGGEGDGQGDGDGEGRGDGSDGSGAGKGEPHSGCGSGSGGAPAPCELDPSDDAGGHAAPATDAERDRIEIATAAAIRDEASKGRGTVPAGLTSRAEQLLAPPKVPWRKVLAGAVRRSVASRLGDFDTTYSRRHRRRHGGPIVWPGNYQPVPTIAVVRDTSGSMGADELNRVTSEVEGIARQVGIRGRELRVLDVDAAVHEVRDYRGATSIAEITGRGGTDMCIGIDAALELRPRPSAVVVISDGYTPWPATKTAVPLVICIVGQGGEAPAKNTPPWAATVVVED